VFFGYINNNVDLMSRKQTPIITYKGRSLGIVVLTVAQLFIGAIHVFFGLLLLVFENISFLQETAAYDVYTFTFGLLALVFAVFFWLGKKWGWVGTVAVSLFVIVADSLTLLDLPSIPGIPKFPALTEIVYSLLVALFLLQSGVRSKYLGSI
jgi:vacuolar-type H+-ATPase subunit I/STV1